MAIPLYLHRVSYSHIGRSLSGLVFRRSCTAFPVPASAARRAAETPARPTGRYGSGICLPLAGGTL